MLDMPLDQIRENYRRVTFGFGHPVPTFPELDGMERVRVEGRQVSILASRNSEAIAAMGRAKGAAQVEVAPISLREIFLETVQEQNKRDQQAHWEQQHALV